MVAMKFVLRCRGSVVTCSKDHDEGGSVVRCGKDHGEGGSVVRCGKDHGRCSKDRCSLDPRLSKSACEEEESLVLAVYTVHPV